MSRSTSRLVGGARCVEELLHEVVGAIRSHGDLSLARVRVPACGHACSRCGATSEDDADGEGLPAGLVARDLRRGVDRLCARCTREHVRDIEAKLDEDWWA